MIFFPINFSKINSLLVSNFKQSLIIGSTIQAVGQVTAAGYAISPLVGETSTLIKMIRILALGPFLFIASMLSAKSKDTNKFSIQIPYFIYGFVVLFFLKSINFIPDNYTFLFQILSKNLLIIAMAAIGLRVSFENIVQSGFKVFLLAIVSFVLQVIIAIHIVTY